MCIRDSTYAAAYQTTSDTDDYPEFSYDHMLRFVRLTMSFVVELGGWATPPL